MARVDPGPQLASVKDLLLDTGPMVAYLSAIDPFHQNVGRAIDVFRGTLHTTSSVVTEAMHFLSATDRGPELLGLFLAGSGARVHDLCQPDEVLQAADLMLRYADTPMDFADANLLQLADRVGVRAIMTLDRRGFSTFRTPHGAFLEMVDVFG
ncbi:MAG: PIN domain-containing protein [Acidobacteria bacterium]|nr:PIN domain-containing protein [Acidobacteriota bacterium]